MPLRYDIDTGHHIVIITGDYAEPSEVAHAADGDWRRPAVRSRLWIPARPARIGAPGERRDSHRHHRGGTRVLDQARRTPGRDPYAPRDRSACCGGARAR